MSRNRTIALILAISAILSQSNAATFQGVVGLSDHAFSWIDCWGVSGDGSVAFGSSRSSDGLEAFRWTAEAGIQTLGDLPGGQVGGYALDSSYDGSVIVGRSYTNNSSGYSVERAYVWTQEAGMTELPLPDDPSFNNDSTGAFAVSADGRIITGLVSKGYMVLLRPDRTRSVIWNLENDTTTLMDWPYGTGFRREIYGVDISANGSTILVNGSLSGFSESFLWTQEHGYTETIARAGSLSGDGRVMIGDSFPEPPYRDAFRWTQEEGQTRIGLPAGWYENQAYDLSYDGSVVVGSLLEQPMDYDNNAAYIWNEQDGLRLAKDIFEEDYGLDLTGWTLTSAIGISDDGMTIVGNGINPDGVDEGWIATIPEPATIILLALGSIALRRQNRGQLPI